MSVRIEDLVVRNILPRANNSYDIGSSSNKFNDIYATYFRGSLKGNADTATKWENASTLTIGLTGKSVQGDGNVSWTLAEIGALPLTGGTITGVFALKKNNVSSSIYSQDGSFLHYSTDASHGHWFNTTVRVKGDIYAGSNYSDLVLTSANISSSYFIRNYTTATAASSISNTITMAELPASAVSSGDPTYGVLLTSKINDYRGFQIAVGEVGNIRIRAIRSSGTNGYGDWKTMLDNTNYSNWAMPISYWNWSGQNGQPNWLWGGNDYGAWYVYNPSNFSVNYANSAGKLNTARTISLGGILSGSTTFDGSGNVSINCSFNNSDRSITTNEAGWHCFAYHSKPAPRGNVDFYIYAVGGYSVPGSSHYEAKFTWSSRVYALNAEVGYPYISNFRVSEDDTNIYLEGYFSGAASDIRVLVYSSGRDVYTTNDQWTWYSGALPKSYGETIASVSTAIGINTTGRMTSSVTRTGYIVMDNFGPNHPDGVASVETGAVYFQTIT